MKKGTGPRTALSRLRLVTAAARLGTDPGTALNSPLSLALVSTAVRSGTGRFIALYCTTKEGFKKHMMISFWLCATDNNKKIAIGTNDLVLLTNWLSHGRKVYRFRVQAIYSTGHLLKFVVPDRKKVC